MRNLMLTLTAILAVTLQAQTIDTRRTVSSQGVAEARMKPDRASITLGVETEGKNASAVKRDNDDAMRQIFAALAEAGVKPTDIQTSNLTLQPVHNWRPEGKREFLKYQMRNTIHVTVRDIAKLDDILDKAVGVGGNMVESIDFEVSTANAIRDSLRAAAAVNAKTKAQQMAEAVGARVGKLLTINEASEDTPRPFMMKSARMMAADDAESAPTVSGGEMVVRVTVAAMFELE
jgi:uncharacterized protein YggE